MAVEYFYWGLTSLLGAQAYRCNNIAGEWEPCTAELMESMDPVLTELLTREEHNLPTVIPDGSYMGSGSVSSSSQFTQVLTQANEARNGEEVCEGHGFNANECEEIDCCHWNSNLGKCFSSVGRNTCPSDPDAQTDDDEVDEPDDCSSLFYFSFHFYDAENDGVGTLGVYELTWGEDGWPEVDLTKPMLSSESD